MTTPDFWWRKAGLISSLFFPVSKIYEAVANRPFGKGYSSPLKVLCIGNFVVGGAGKTPLSLFIAECLLKKGHTVCFLTRGFKGRLEGPHLVDLKSDKASDVGDEPLLLARKAETVIAKDRVAGLKYIEQSLKPDLVIMDDGFQSAKIKPHHALLVVDTARGLGNGCVLPAGPLRARFETQLHHADSLFLIDDGRKKADSITNLKTAFAKQQKPILSGKLNLLDKPEKDQPYLAFSGIGDPSKFFHSLKQAGFNIIEEHAFPDHHFFTKKDAETLLEKAEKISAILITTQKDAARLSKQEGFLEKLFEATTIAEVSIVSEDKAILENWLSSLDL